MLPKQHRLPSNTRFPRSTIVKSPFFLLRIQANRTKFSRFGFVVSKKVDKRAVVRNRLKRVFRSCIEEMRENILPGNDFLFVLSPSLLSASRNEILVEITTMLKKARLL